MGKSSEIYYRESKNNKDDDCKYHETYACPDYPVGHRFIVVIMRHSMDCDFYSILFDCIPR